MTSAKYVDGSKVEGGSHVGNMGTGQIYSSGVFIPVFFLYFVSVVETSHWKEENTFTALKTEHFKRISKP